MTTTEFKDSFNILYDSIASINAPGLDDFEISSFLTQAQLEIIKEYNGPINKYKQSFEGSDKRRADLRELVVDYSVVPDKMDKGVSDNSYTANLPDDLFLIKYEAGYYQRTGCDKKIVTIVPAKYDEYHDIRRNPFRKINSNKAYRLDIQSDAGVKVVELVTEEPLDTYQIRYIKYPTPIILTDLGSISSEPLSIDGITVRTECKLDKELHREILDRAVTLAMVAYKGQSAQLQAQSTQRNN